MQFLERTLDNGLTILGEHNPDAYSAAVGFFVRTGSRDETPDVAGVSHFLEHMVFKGTERRSAEDVNREFDEIGANYNASTSEEQTIFYAAVLPEYLPKALDLLSDILRPRLSPDDFEMEKKVILEEISRYADMPPWVAWEKCMELHFAQHPLGRSVLGTTESITALKPQQMRDYFDRRYRAGNMALAVAGNFDWDAFTRLAEAACARWPEGTPDRTLRPAQPNAATHVVTRNATVLEHVVQMAAAPTATSHERYAAKVLATFLGDEQGSRFYWELVDSGLAESAELNHMPFEDSGAYVMFLVGRPEQTPDNLARIRRICREVVEQGATEPEVEQAKNKLSSALVLGTERPRSRLSRLGMNWLYHRRYVPLEQDLDKLAAVTVSDIAALCRRYPLDAFTTVGVGPLAAFDAGTP